MTRIAIPEGMETRFFIMAEHVLNEIPELLATAFPGRKPWIIADGNTWEAAGKELSGLLKEQYPPKIFPASPRLHPQSSLSDAIAGEMPSDAVPLAVGSGVINDVIKRAAGIRNIPYCCVPTACSVDGYTSYGAAMTVDGFKKTLPCPAPYAIATDLSVLRSAPADMFAAGYADLFTKIPAGADWLIADALGIEKIRANIWELVQSKLRERIADPSDMGPVFEGLAATGYSMQLYRESRPASGAEHLMSHIWEMEGLQYKGEDVSHGFKVAIGVLASLRLMNFIIGHSVSEAQSMALAPETAEQRLGHVNALLKRGCYGPAPAKLAMEKFLQGKELEERRRAIWNVWEDLRVKLRGQLLSEAETTALFRQAHVPVLPEEIGLSHEQYRHGVESAQLIRKRYTVLDFLYEAGLFPAALATL